MISESSQAQENSQGNQPAWGGLGSATGGGEESDIQRLEDNRVIKVCTQDSEGERLEERKSGQENEVERVLMAFPVEQTEVDKDTEHGDVERPRAGLG